MGDLSHTIRSERLELIGFLGTLTPEQWTTRSLCRAWTVQEVAAHLAWAPNIGVGEGLGGMLRAGLRVNKFIADHAVREALKGPEAILKQLRVNAATGARATGLPEQAGLVDAVVHPIDIRRPLHAHHEIPAEAFGPAADFLAHTRWPASIPVGGSVHRRVHGLRLVADDQDWSHGHGPEVHGSGETVMLVLAGRPVEPHELSGPGATLLLSRL